jgi:hypothetical protein
MNNEGKKIHILLLLNALTDKIQPILLHASKCSGMPPHVIKESEYHDITEELFCSVKLLQIPLYETALWFKPSSGRLQ